MPRILRKPQAINDIMGEALYFELNASEQVANRFIDAVDESFSELSVMPLMGRKSFFKDQEAQEVREWPVTGRFSAWKIYYRPLNDGIEVFRVLRSSRDIAQEMKKTEW